jgi:hypothetical protein
VRILFAASVLVLAGCGASTPPPPKSASSGSEVSAPPPEKRAAAERDVLGPLDEAVPPAPASCTPGEPLPARESCDGALNLLASAVTASEPSAALASLERCSEFEPGLIRALRAELGPVECGDVLVASVVGEGAKDEVSRGVRELLLAYGISARLRRLAHELPGAPQDRKKAAIVQFLEQEVFPWAKREAVALERLARKGSELRGYARGIAAVEAGMADMRFVNLVREVPLPEEMLADEEVREVYYSSLEEALDARKNRGRDASLVGLIELERAGVVFDARVHLARDLLVQVFGGSRLKAIDSLLIPKAQAPSPAAAAEAIASSVPSPYLPLLLGDARVTGLLLTAASARGIPAGWDQALPADLSESERLTLAWTRFHKGRTYFRSSDFVAAADLAKTITESSPLLSEAQLIRALGAALATGPNGPVELMRRGSFVGLSLGSSEALEQIARGTGPLAGAAAFNLAYLRGLVLPPGAALDWRQIATQFRDAEKKLGPGLSLAARPTEEVDARARASDAAQTAAATSDAIQSSSRAKN